MDIAQNRRNGGDHKMARLTVQFPEETSRILAELSEKDHMSKTEVLRRALALYMYLEKQTSEGKHKIAIADENDRIVKEIVITK
jgi:hypothetical protein